MKKNTSLGKGNMTKVALMLTAVVLIGTIDVQAQNIGTAIDAARTSVAGIRSNVGNLILAIGGVVGLAGAIRVYVKWQNGDQDTQKHLIGWLAASIFLVLAGTIISGFFG